jgi:hypothetical protein
MFCENVLLSFSLLDNELIVQDVEAMDSADCEMGNKMLSWYISRRLGAIAVLPISDTFWKMKS